LLSEAEIEGTTFKVYLYLVREARSVGPRDVMRGAGLSSPSVAYRHLQKLENLGLIQRDIYGEYVVKEKTTFKGYIWVGRSLMPRLVFYSFFFLGLLIVESIVVAFRIATNESIGLELLLLTFVTSISSALFMTEGVVLLRRLKARQQSNSKE
jgi:hypothetical protein